jgi:hypothetical protein
MNGKKCVLSLLFMLSWNAVFAEIKDFAVNPTGSSFAVIEQNRIDIYSFENGDMYKFKIDKKLRSIRPESQPLAIIYSSDAKYLLVSDIKGEIYVYDTKKYELQFTLQGKTAATSMDMSANEYFIAAVTGNTIDIWNFETKLIRMKLPLAADANDAAFSTDGSLLAVTTRNNQVIIYNTINWEIEHIYDADGTVSSPAFNADDKYLALIYNDKNIVILDFRKKQIIQKRTEEKKINTCRFFYNTSNHKTYIGFNHSESILFWQINRLESFYTKTINQEVNKKMNEWLKKRQDESTEDYKIRVNDETRTPQTEHFKQEVTTALAGDIVTNDNPVVGIYNMAKGLLTINFTALPSIEIPVLSDDLTTFRKKNKLTYHDAVYLLNENDEFEVAYLEISNAANNKEYIYDNIGRTPPVIDDFVPLDILQIAQQAESNLRAATEAVIEQSRMENLLTDKTDIQVGTEVLADVDAEGNKILNYMVKYKYVTFEGEEDFPPGGYDLNQSNAALSLLKIIKQTLEGEDFAQYLDAGNRVKINIIGSADASPVRGKIAYDGRYGNFELEPYYQNGGLNNLTVTKETGITSNAQLAYIRTASVKDWLSNNISTLQQTRNDYQSQIEVSEEKGSEFRRVEIQFTIIDAFK